MHKRVIQAAAVIMIYALVLTGCAPKPVNISLAKERNKKSAGTGFVAAGVGSYDSADTAVVMSVSPENQAVTFLNLKTDREYTLYYDGTTYIKDKYEGPMTISQVRAGDIVDVNFLKGKRHIASMQMSPAAWVYHNVSNYDFGGINKTASIGTTTYSLPDGVVVLSEEERVEVMDIVNQDVVSVRGVGHEIYSINVEKGHGYLRLKNDLPLIGGWIEVGNTIIREITEDMLLIVPEGRYHVQLSNGNVSCEKEIVVERDKEVLLDVGDVKIAQDKTGSIIFTVSPENAKVSIDGEPVDISKAVKLPYGIHKVSVEAEGYDSLTKYIQVGSEHASISFALEEKVKEKEEEHNNSSVSQNRLESTINDLPNNSVSANGLNNASSSVSANTVSAKTVNKVYIDAPLDVEVYLDGNYVGIAPVKFNKVAGSHSITLRKKGYQSKSYTIYLYNDGEDITYSFSDLVPDAGASGSKEKGHTVAINVMKDGEAWEGHGKQFALKNADGSGYEMDMKAVPDGKYTLCEVVDKREVTTDIEVTVEGNNESVVVDYYTVTFYDGEAAYGEDSAQKPQIVMKDKKASEPEEPSKDGYVFSGWKTEDGGGESFDFSIPIDGQTNIYASWETENGTGEGGATEGSTGSGTGEGGATGGSTGGGTGEGGATGGSTGSGTGEGGTTGDSTGGGTGEGGTTGDSTGSGTSSDDESVSKNSTT